MKIKKLPVDVRSHIRSGVVITDATQCVLELIHNSLDAHSTKIAVKINLSKYHIQVSDNGSGIPADDLNLLGERYMTSKCQGVKDLDGVIPTYGYKGEAIASLLDVCGLLTIETKSGNEKCILIKVFLKDKALPITKSKKEKSGTGTTVTIEDFMLTMPVRRRRINEIFDLQEVKGHIQYLAIVHHEVCFSLYDENKSVLLLQTHKKTDSVSSFSDLYGYALTNCLMQLNFKSGVLELGGFLSEKKYHLNQLQLVYVNQRIVYKNEIHKLVDKLMTKYIRRNDESNEEHHVFLLKIRCPYNFYEITPNMKKPIVEFKNWDAVLKFIYRSVKSTLKNDDKDESLKPVAKKIAKSHPVKIFRKKEGKVNPEFGTSQLITGVRGVPVKRKLISSTPKIPEKTKKIQEIDRTFESESPISGKLENIIFKKPKPPEEKNSEEILLKQFQKWLKSKAKSNSNAFNFYKEFINFKKNIGVDFLDSSASEMESPCQKFSPIISPQDFEKKKEKKLLKSPILKLRNRPNLISTPILENDWNLLKIQDSAEKIKSPYFDSFMKYNNYSPPQDLSLKIYPVDRSVQTSFVREVEKMDRSVQVTINNFAESEDEGFFSAKTSGNSPDKKNNPAEFSLAERFCFVPKGFSPNFKGDTHPKNVPDLNSQERNRIRDSIPDSENFLDNVKWLNSEKYEIPDRILDNLRAKTEEKMKYCENEILSATVQKSAIKIHNLLNSHSYSKDYLLNIKVIGQIDEKFIATLISVSKDKKLHMLTLFDQHAVDERIQLEKLLDDYRTDEGAFKSTEINPPVICSLNESTVGIVSNFEEKLKIYGMKLKIISSDTVSVEEVPTCLYDKDERNLKNKENKSLKYLIQNLLVDVGEELMKTRGATSTIPRVIWNVIASQACRSAVKFNQSLTIAEMERMMADLAKCREPFKCAHGRQSIAPIIDLNDFKNSVLTKPKINIQKLKDLLHRTEGTSVEEESV